MKSSPPAVAADYPRDAAVLAQDEPSARRVHYPSRAPLNFLQESESPPSSLIISPRALSELSGGMPALSARTPAPSISSDRESVHFAGRTPAVSFSSLSSEVVSPPQAAMHEALHLPPRTPAVSMSSDFGLGAANQQLPSRTPAVSFSSEVSLHQARSPSASVGSDADPPPLAPSAARLSLTQLDSRLLSGSLDVDEYASALLRQHSLDRALRDYDELKARHAEVEVRLKLVQQENARLKLALGSAAPGAEAAAADSLDDDAALAAQIASRFTTLSQLGKFAQQLARQGLLRREDGDDVDWYASTFAAELDQLHSTAAAAPPDALRLEEQTAAFEAYERNLLGKLADAARGAEALQREAARALRLVERLAVARDERAVLRRALQAWRAAALASSRALQGQRLRARVVLAHAFAEWRNQAIQGVQARFFARRAKQAVARLVLRTWARLGQAKPPGPDEQLQLLRAQAAKQRVPALMLAASRGMTEAVLALIHEGSAVNMAERGSGASPLHAAARAANADICEILLEAGASPGAVDDGGETPLHAAAKAGDAALGVALALLRHGADACACASGRAPLHLAVDAGAKAMVTTLLQYGAKLDQACDSSGRTPLHVAASRADADCIAALLPGLGGAARAREFRRDALEQTPLHCAAAAADSPDAARALDALLAAGFDVDAVSASAQTALHVFCQNPGARAECLRLFTQAGADLDRQDCSGNTALHFACMQHQRQLALELVLAGADLFYANDQGATALDMETQGFAAQLLSSVQHAPFQSRAERALRGLMHCQVCKSPLALNMFKRRIADHCRRCGRLCCLDCCVDRVLLRFPDGKAETSPVRVCAHCSEILKSG